MILNRRVLIHNNQGGAPVVVVLQKAEQRLVGLKLLAGDKGFVGEHELISYGVGDIMKCHCSQFSRLFCVSVIFSAGLSSRERFGVIP